MGRVLLVVALMGVVGCVPVTKLYWTHPAHSAANFDRDLYECKRDAAMVPRVAYPTAPTPGRGTGFAGGFEEGFNKGIYYQGIAAARDAEERADELFALCMRSRGYRLEEREVR